MVTQLYRITSEIWGTSPRNFGGPKTFKFWRDFRQLRDLIVNVSKKKQDIVKRKTALQTAITPAYTGWAKKVSQHNPHITSSNTGRFSKFLQYNILQEIYNKTVIKCPTSP